MASLLSQWRRATRPVPGPDSFNPRVLAQKRKQRALLRWTAGIILVVAAGSFIYNYISSAPARARAEMQVGIRKMSPGIYDQAVVSFDRAINIWPELAEAYLNRGVSEHVLGRRPEALADLEKAIDLDPSLIRAYNERGQIYMESAQPQKAIQDFAKSIEVKPSLEGYYQRGQAYEAVGDHGKAIADYDAAISEYRESPYTYRARATAKRKSGDVEGATADDQAAQQIEDSLSK